MLPRRKEQEESQKYRHPSFGIWDTVSFAAARLLEAGAWEEGLEEVLERLGRATGVDRVYIIQNDKGSEGEALTSTRHKWTASGLSEQIDGPGILAFPYLHGECRRWVEIMGNKEPVHGRMKDFPPGERAVLRQQGISSIMVMPIFTESEQWGFICFEDWHTERRWVKSEREALKIIARILGAAIQHQKTRSSLAASEEHYRLLAENISEGLWIIDQNLKASYVSPSISHTRGFTPQEAVNQNLEKIFTPPLVALIRETLAEKLTSRSQAPASHVRPTILELEQFCKDGSTVWTEIKASLLRDNEGRPAGILGVTRDISDRKRIESALRESEEQLRHLFESAPDSLFFHDKGKISEVNQQACNSLGYTREELLNMSILDIEAGLDQEELSKSWRVGDADTLYGMHRRKDGTTFPVEVRVADFNYQGRQHRLAVARDISARLEAEQALRESEEKFRLLVSQIPAVVFKGYADWSIDCLDDKIEELTGYTKEDFDSRRLKWCDLIPPEELDSVTSFFKEALKTTKSYVREHRLKRKDGGYVWVQCRGQIFCDEHGRVEFVSGVTFDITAQKKIEEELSRQNEKYRFLAEESPIGIAVIDRDGHLTYINRKFEEIFGYSLEDIPTKRRWLLRAYPDKELRKRATYLEYQSLNESLGEDAGPIKSKITCKDGSIKTIELKPFQLASGDLYVIYEDVTDREQFQAALKQSEVKYRTLVEQIPAVTYITSLDGPSTTLYVSPQIEAILGFSPADYDADPDIWRKQLHPDDRDRVLAEVARCQASGEPFASEYRMLTRQGAIVWFRDEAWLVRNAEGDPLFLQGVMLDITKLKVAQESQQLSEERFRIIFQEAGIGIILRDIEGHLLACNPAILEMLGFREEELYGTDIEKITHPDDLFEGLVLYHEVVTGKRNHYQREKRYLCKDGRAIWGRISVSQVRDNQGEPRYIITMVEDITERKHAEEERRRAEERLSESEKKLRLLTSQLFASLETERRRISRELHDEMGQDLAVLKFFLSSLPENLNKDQRNLKHDSQKMLKFIDSIIDNVRRLCRDLSPYLLEELGLMAALKSLLKESSQKFNFAYSTKIDSVEKLFTREARVNIYRIFQEALTNIGKHSNASRVDIEILKTKEFVSFKIVDNGRGFESNSFSKEKHMVKRGMGLTAMQERAHMLGASLQVRSKIGEGTELSFMVPVD